MSRCPKRQFQPSINSYFQRAPISPHDGNSLNLLLVDRAKPQALPSAVQASLLQVGMRVRKAVPEGYKNYIDPKSNRPHTPRISPNHDEGCPNITIRPAELSPFCGIHKVGGHSSQWENVLPPSLATRGELYDGEAMDGITSSQDSQATTISTDSVPSPQIAQKLSKKRSLEEDETTSDGVPSFPKPLESTSARPIAQPNLRRKHLRAVARDQHYRTSRTGEMDFDEASFLQPVS